MSTISIEGISNDGAMTIKAGDTMSDTIMVRLNPLGTLHDYSLLPITVELPEESGIRPSRDSNEIYYKIYYKRSTYPWLSPMKADMKKYKMVGFILHYPVSKFQYYISLNRNSAWEVNH